jgi:hypothetical protein
MFFKEKKKKPKSSTFLEKVSIRVLETLFPPRNLLLTTYKCVILRVLC